MAEVVRYVDPDASGAGDGTSWTDAYTSLAAWESAEQTDLVTDGDWHHVYCRSSSGTEDSTGFNLAGWTTGEGNGITIEGDGTYVFSGYISFYSSYVNLYNIVFDTDDDALNWLNATDPHVEIAYCTFLGPTSGTYYAIETSSTSGGFFKIYNNLIKYVRGINIDGDSGLSVYVENNTIIASGYGMLERASGVMTLKAKNNYIESPNPFFGTWEDDDDYNDYNVTSDNSSHVALGSHGAYNETAVFTDAANNDYSLDSTDTACIDQGTDLSGGDIGFSDDIEGTTRSGTWDIGAYEYVSAGGGVTIPIMVHHYKMAAGM